MASEDIEDIRRVLAICFRDGETLGALDIERIISFDMEWVGPDEAEKVVQALIGKGWLTGEEDALTSTVSLTGVQSPLGWFPRPSRLLHPVHPEQQQPLSNTRDDSKPLPKASVPVTNHASLHVSDSQDPRAKLTQRLAKFISKSSEISLDEVERRAKRKQQALGYVSTWMCLALVAREQNLSMKEITDALATR
jgi:hypothetical protein|tara:strand:+ start:125 stop:706 length:582 start_codon:yes stop_codon:yes gene_type:complete